MNRYLDTVNRQEWSRNYIDEPIPDGVILVPDTCPYFAEVPSGMKLVWNPMPELVAMTAEELNPPLPETNYSPKSFIERFTIDELVAIYAHAAQTVQVRIWLDRLTGADYILLSDQSLKDGMAYMVYQGLVTQERHDQIMDLP